MCVNMHEIVCQSCVLLFKKTTTPSITNNAPCIWFVSPLNWISEYLYYFPSLRLGIMNVLMSDVTLSLETQLPKKRRILATNQWSMGTLYTITQILPKLSGIGTKFIVMSGVAGWWPLLLRCCTFEFWGQSAHKQLRISKAAFLFVTMHYSNGIMVTAYFLDHWLKIGIERFE